jgi:hypothetical protein
MATARQEQAARQNLEKARQAQSARSRGERTPPSPGLRTAQENRMADEEFAFPKERKEPLVDARHVRNAIARFSQVEGVSDRERDQAWKRIQQAAKRYDIEIEADSWRELSQGGKASRR